MISFFCWNIILIVDNKNEMKKIIYGELTRILR
jgi:hypothetical protein